MIIIVLIILTIVALPLGIVKGLADAKAKKEDILFKKEVLENMKK